MAVPSTTFSLFSNYYDPLVLMAAAYSFTNPTACQPSKIEHRDWAREGGFFYRKETHGK